MSSDNSDKNDPSYSLPQDVAALAEALPKPVALGTLQAINRLIGSAFSIPIAHLEAKAQEIRDKSYNRSAYRKAMTQAVVNESLSHEQRLAEHRRFLGLKAEIEKGLPKPGETVGFLSGSQDRQSGLEVRSINYVIEEAKIKQYNREKVAVEAVDEIFSDPSAWTEDAAKPEDDWLNVFVQYSERASSEEIQKLWGRILAGQVRKPGSFSLRTLRFISELEQSDAKDFEEIAKLVIQDSVVKPKNWDRGPEFLRAVRLESAGLIKGGISIAFDANSDGDIVVLGKHHGLVGRTTPNRSVHVPIYGLTEVGKQVLTLLPQHDETVPLRLIAEHIKRENMREIILFELQSDHDSPLEVLYKRDDDV